MALKRCHLTAIHEWHAIQGSPCVQGLQDEDSPTPNVLFAQRLQTGPVMTLRQIGSVLDLVIEHADAFTLREATRQSGAPSFSAAFDGFHLRRIRRL